MIIQPKGYKRKSTYSNLLLEIRRQLDLIAAQNNVSRSFVITTLLARQLKLSLKVADYENYQRNDTRNSYHRSNTKIRRIK